MASGFSASTISPFSIIAELRSSFIFLIINMANRNTINNNPPLIKSWRTFVGVRDWEGVFVLCFNCGFFSSSCSVFLGISLPTFRP